MKVLTVTDVSDETVAELARRAAAHGVAVEEEARRVLEDAVPMTKGAAFKAHLLAMPDVGDDWMFDRNDPRMKRPDRPPVNFED